MKKLVLFLVSFLFFSTAVVGGSFLIPASTTNNAGGGISQIANEYISAYEDEGPLNDGYWSDEGNYSTDFLTTGEGSETRPYYISTAAELAGLAYLINNSETNAQYNSCYVIQTDDIDLSNYWWDPIGNYTSSSVYNAFRGTYNGANYVISGLFTKPGTTSAYSYQGLFGYVYGPNALITNVTLKDSLVQGYSCVAGIIGFYRGGITVSNCKNYAIVIGNGNNLSGIASTNDNHSSNFYNCINYGDIIGSGSYVNGIGRGDAFYYCVNFGDIVSYFTGQTQCYGIGDGTSYYCINLGNVFGDGSYVAGIGNRSFQNSINLGNVSSGRSTYIGGISTYYGGRNSINLGCVSSEYYTNMSVGGLTGSLGRYYRLCNSINLGLVKFSENYKTGIGGVLGGLYNSTSSYGAYNLYYGGNCLLENAVGTDSTYQPTNSGYLDDLFTLARTESWYTDTSNWYNSSSYLWDFETVWGIDENINGGLPYLRDVSGLTPNFQENWINHYADSFAGGTGTESDPYLISTAEELARMAYLINNTSNYSTSHFQLTDDIDLSDYWWTPIGTTTNVFAGNFNGAGYKIYRIYTPSMSQNNVGLFGVVSGNENAYANISNVEVKQGIIQGYQNVGSIVGSGSYLNIDNVKGSVIIYGETNNVGGIIGQAASNVRITYSSSECNVISFSGDNVGGISGFGGEIEFCSSLSGVGGENNVGGLVGSASQNVENSYNRGAIAGRTSNAGGLVGNLQENVTAATSYNTGFVSSRNGAGGIVGYNSGIVKSTFNIGEVDADALAGAVIGSQSGSAGSVSYSYFGGDCSLTAGFGDGSNSGTILDDSLATNATTLSWFITNSNWDSEYLWDFVNIWEFREDENDNLPVFGEVIILTLNYHLSATNLVDLSIVANAEISSNIVSSGGRVLISTLAYDGNLSVYLSVDSDYDYYIAFGQNPTAESDLNETVYSWALSGSIEIDVYVFERYAITYYANNGSEDYVVDYKLHNVPIYLRENTFSNPHYNFHSWNKSSYGDGVSRFPNEAYNVNSPLDLFAKWDGEVYTITLNHTNGVQNSYIYLKYGDGFYQDITARVPITQISIPSYTNYQFGGYYSEENGAGENIIDSDGTIIDNNTIFTSDTVIFAYWQANIAALYDENGGYWYVEIGKMPQSRVTDESLIAILDNDDVLNDTDGVTVSRYPYYFAGMMLLAKEYNGEEYCFAFNNWYKVEPIRWRLESNLNQESGYSTSEDTFAVSDSIVYVGRYSNSSMTIDDGYLSANEEFSYVDFFYHNFSAVEKNYLVNFTAESEKYSLSGNITETSSNFIFLSSQSEIEQIADKSVSFSDLVLDYLSLSNVGNFYFTRDLASNLNNIVSYTQSGITVNQRPNYILGMRFTIKLDEYACE